jgi:hypothetical protein
MDANVKTTTADEHGFTQMGGVSGAPKQLRSLVKPRSGEIVIVRQLPDQLHIDQDMRAPRVRQLPMGVNLRT